MKTHGIHITELLNSSILCPHYNIMPMMMNIHKHHHYHQHAAGLGWNIALISLPRRLLTQSLASPSSSCPKFLQSPSLCWRAPVSSSSDHALHHCYFETTVLLNTVKVLQLLEQHVICERNMFSTFQTTVLLNMAKVLQLLGNGVICENMFS